jgi:branched-chain amino acid transport system ATP-binding protein
MSASRPGFLSVRNLEATYDDAILALRGVSLEVAEGAIVALLGPNGSGKTTTLKAISNLIRAERGRVSRGSILWRDEPIDGADPSDLVQQGLVQVLEGRHCFPQLTVEENILTGGFARRLSRVEINAGLERIYRWFPRLKERRKTRSGYTSGGEQQMTAIARALMTRPTFVLLDEPSMGLAPIVVAEIFEIIRHLNCEEGVTFLLAEQNANLALKYAHHAYVLESGRVALSGAGVELAGRDDVHEFYFGAASSGNGKLADPASRSAVDSH